jgi:hypothetical protein
MPQTLPLELIVQVDISRETSFPSARDFGSFNFVGKSGRIPISQRIRSYNNLAGVAAEFDTSTEEYKAAQQWFSTGVTPIPNLLYISRWVNVDVPSQLRGGVPLLDVEEWTLVDDGSFRINIDGTLANVTGLDFSLVTTLNGVASVIQAGLVAAGFVGSTCVFDSKFQQFWITSGVSGSVSSMSYLTTATASVGTDISGLTGPGDYINGRSGFAFSLDQGLDAETITAALDAIDDKNDTWYGFAFDKLVRDDANAKEASIWAESKIKLFFTTTNDANVLVASATTDIAYFLKSQNRVRTVVFYHQDSNLYPEVAFASRGFVLDAGSETWKFKRLSGISVSPLTQPQFASAVGKNCNVFVEFGGTGITAEGVVAVGEFIDIIRGVDWQKNTMQINVYNILLTPPKVPFSDAGVTQGLSGITQTLELGVSRGFYAENFDQDGNVIPAFEVNAIPVNQVPVLERSQRKYNYYTFRAHLAGAIHFAKISGTVTVAF